MVSGQYPLEMLGGCWLLEVGTNNSQGKALGADDDDDDPGQCPCPFPILIG